MKNYKLIHAFLSSYQLIKNQKLVGRYLNYSRLKPEIGSLPALYNVQEEGKSYLGIPIESINFGKGPIKIFGWSQMHGNESTTTKALLDLLNYFSISKDIPEIANILQQCTFKFIPMLNPDGAEKYTRENANGVDLNRDAEILSQKESQVLRLVFDNFKPDFCFNLHDQRTIFGVGDPAKPATLSFLAPAMNEERSISPSRKNAMQIIADIDKDLQNVLPGQLGRFDDSFNINCTGDRFMAFDVPTILFEAGHYQADYHRDISRKYMAAAIFSAIISIVKETYVDRELSEYQRIPENQKIFFDIILRNALLDGELVDVAIQYNEKLFQGNIHFEPRVQIIGTDLCFMGHQELNCKGGEVTHGGGEKLGENDVVGNILLNRDNFSFKIE